MSKKFSLYIITILGLLFLQSCVSNYVVSKPMNYTKTQTITKNNTTTPKAQPTKVNTSSSKKIDKALAQAEKPLNQKELADNENFIEYNNKIHNIMDEALTYLGTPYRMGGTSRRGIDCSAFVLSVYANAMGISLPRVSASQALQGEKVSKSELKKGDLVFFSHGSRISHVGIVYDVEQNGEIKFIHSATSKGVTVNSLSDKYWAPRFRLAKRIINDNVTENVDFSNFANN